MRTSRSSGVSGSCPSWCRVDHTNPQAQTQPDPMTHLSGRLVVRDTFLWLTQQADGRTDAAGQPRVQVGDVYYTLHEAEVLIAALVQLTDTARPEAEQTMKLPAMRAHSDLSEPV